MKKLTARLIALSLGINVAVATAIVFLPHPAHRYPYRCLLSAKEKVLPGPQTRLGNEAPAQNARVLAEIARLGDHPWAGVYRSEGLMGGGPALAIAPGAGFTLYEGSHCADASGYRATGTVLSTQGSRLALRIELESPRIRSSLVYHLDEILHLVRWGELSFAVPEWRMERFCDEASNEYEFPIVPFRYLGARDDVRFGNGSRPAGKPQVPSAFRHLIVDEPIRCRIVALAGWTQCSKRNTESRSMHDAVYSVDAGSRDRLAVGMRLFVESEHRSVRPRVDQVGDTMGRFQVCVFEGERAWAEGLVGKVATTLHPNAVTR